MPGCAAVGCNNRSEKGYTMKCFPRDPVLRQIWKERVGRADWEPSNNSFLCHVHFESNQWIVTPSGRVKLRKGAVPSIFTVTSTRKSSKKRAGSHTLDDDFEEYEVEYLENESEYPSFLSTMVKSSENVNSLEEDESVNSIDIQKMENTTFQEVKVQNCKMENSDYHVFTQDSLQKFHSNKVFIVSDENHKNHVRQLIKDSSYMMISKDKNKLNQDTINANMKHNVKIEVKDELDDEKFNDNEYKEIEKKLKLICDGEIYDNVVTNKSNNLDVDRINRSSSSNSSVNSNYVKNTQDSVPIENQINSHIVSVEQEISTILESELLSENHIGDEGSLNTNKNTIRVEKENRGDKLHNYVKNASLHIQNVDTFRNEESSLSDHEVQSDSACQEKGSTMKRKKELREIMLKSIKKSVTEKANNINSLSNDGIEKNTSNCKNRDQEMDTSCCSLDDKENTVVEKESKFTIKVTGIPEDICEIIKDFDSSPCIKKSWKSDTLNQHDGRFITSVITVENCSTSEKIESSSHQNNLKQPDNGILHKSELFVPENNDNFSFNVQQNIESYDNLKIKFASQNQLENNSDFEITSISNSNNMMEAKVKMQQQIIDKLTSQLGVYQDFERTLKNMDMELKRKHKEVEVLKRKFNKKLPLNKKLMDDHLEDQRYEDVNNSLLHELTNRVNQLEDTNKKLMKSLSAEVQNKKKVEYQVKDRENKIKELNWKLQKASKFLERAEKNTNTYRRKLVTLQTLIRRKNLVDDRKHRFAQMSTDLSTKKFTESSLSTALSILKTCGHRGYMKLLNFNFPLPPLKVLRQKYPNDTALNYILMDEDKVETKNNKMQRNLDTNLETFSVVDCANNDLNSADDIQRNNLETVTGTVQDIFDESSDNEDILDISELQKHIVLYGNTCT